MMIKNINKKSILISKKFFYITKYAGFLWILNCIDHVTTAQKYSLF